MSGELNGTNVLLYRQGLTGFDELVGQLEITNTFNGSAIDVSSKSTGDFVVLLDGELSTKQMTLSGAIIYNNDSTYQVSKQQRFGGVQSKYRLDYNGDKKVLLTGMFDSMADSLPQGSAVQTDFSLVSTGELTKEVNLLSSDNFNLVSSDGLTLITGEPIGN